MLMADTMAIFFVILGLLLAFPGLWVLCRGLWPRAVAKAAAVCGKGLIKPFLAGLPLTAVMIFAAAALGNLGPAEGAGRRAYPRDRGRRCEGFCPDPRRRSSIPNLR